MKFLHQCLVLGAIASIATSCSQDAPWKTDGGETGRISLNLRTDLAVTVSTRAGDSESPVKPEGERFAIRLENSDGSYVKEWENLTKFNDEEGFPRGQYTVTASYGSLNEQGFAKPYYVGNEQITVVPGETSDHSITATLANSMVSVRYTDSFRDYFSSYSASLVADGISTPVAFARTETRPAYVKPGNITVNFNIPSPDGREITVSPASFIAQPRRHYIVTANVKGTENNGTGVLEVLLEENVEMDIQEIVLDDDLYSSLPPEITIQGFSQNGLIETFESVNLEETPEYQIVAFGGIKKAKFTVELTGLDGTLPAFNGEIDLASADLAAQDLVNQSGLKCYGLFKVPEINQEKGNKMATINMKDFIENLDPGEYRISLAVTDALGRVNSVEAKTRADGDEEENPIAFNVKVNRITYDLLEDEVKPRFMGNEVSVIIKTNYAPASEEFTFKAKNSKGSIVDAPIKSFKQITSEDTDNYYFRYILATDNIDDTTWKVVASYPKKDDDTVEISVEVPEYEVELDPFATKVMMKFVPKNPDDLQWMIEKSRLYINGGSVITDSNSISVDPDNGIITLVGCNPGVDNTLTIQFGSTLGGHKRDITFTTEAAADVPNGNFLAANTKIEAKGLQVGGKYIISPVEYAHESSILRYAPDNWATINDFTCWLGSTNKNTWFMVPSTYKDEDKIRIQNVGYNHNGKTPDTSNNGWSTRYYCENAPAESDLNKAAGELFLGTYSYDGSEHRTNGIPFTSRPDALEFEYSYTSLNGDKAFVEVKVLDESGSILVENQGELSDSDGEIVSMPLEGYTYGSKAATIQVRFKSSNSANPPINIPSGGALNEGQGLGNKTISANNYHALATGSVLMIGNVTLKYKGL